MATDLDAGDLGAWVASMQRALDGSADADVPCGGCTACCTSSQFIAVGPADVDALRRIPKALLFPAPRLPAGHFVLGFDERGHCPMLRDGRCSIYEHRPQTCRTYDCRVFAAAGVEVDQDKPAIAAQVVRWRFRSGGQDPEHDRTRGALSAAASFLRDHRTELGLVRGAAQLAAAAVAVHELFLDGEPTLGAVDAALGSRHRPI